jgi:hypothetical protein
MGFGCQTQHGSFTPDKNPVPIVHDAAWISEPVRKIAENIPQGFDKRACQPRASFYTE